LKSKKIRKFVGLIAFNQIGQNTQDLCRHKQNLHL